MRISTAVLYAIAALAAKEGLQPAIATANPENLDARPDAADDAADEKHSIATANVTSVMEPETITAVPEQSNPPFLQSAVELDQAETAKPSDTIASQSVIDNEVSGSATEPVAYYENSSDLTDSLASATTPPLRAQEERTAEPIAYTTGEQLEHGDETIIPPMVDLAAEAEAADNLAILDHATHRDLNAPNGVQVESIAIAPPEISPQTWAIAQNIQVEPMSASDIAQLPALPSSFDTVQGHWAEDFVRNLEQAEVVQGFRETGTIRPDLPVTRAQYAALINQAFSVPPVRPATTFADVPSRYWGQSAIQSAYRMGFLDSVGSDRFAPEAMISRAEAIAALVQGLQLTGGDPVVLTVLDDAGEIPVNLRSAIATAMDGANPATGQPTRLVVNYPDVDEFNPTQNASRGDVMAFVHQALVSSGNLSPIASNARQYIANTDGATRSTPRAITLYVPDLTELEFEQERLQALEDFRGDGRSPGLTILSPTGFGVDNWTPFIGATFQSETRYSDTSDGGMVFGIGAGDAREAVGVEVSYTVASFGGSRDFGTGGFNLRIHRRFSEDFAGAIGWNGIITTGDVDFEDSIYGVVTKIFTLNEDITQPFSRIAVNAGIGNGMFRTEDAVDDGDDTVGVFGGIAIRLAEPVSLITEWTGQDLAIGLSIAPFPNSNFVITPAVRDITGAGDEARFVLGGGISF